MAQRTREQLKERFATGSKPTQQDFADVVDSAVIKVDDKWTPPTKNKYPCELLVKSSSNPTPGRVVCVAKNCLMPLLQGQMLAIGCFAEKYTPARRRTATKDRKNRTRRLKICAKCAPKTAGEFTPDLFIYMPISTMTNAEQTLRFGSITTDELRIVYVLTTDEFENVVANIRAIHSRIGFGLCIVETDEQGNVLPTRMMSRLGLFHNPTIRTSPDGLANNIKVEYIDYQI